jgi:phenylacetate-CoA ligase
MGEFHHRFIDKGVEMSSPEDIRAHQWHSLQPLLRRTWENNDFFRRHWQSSKPSLNIEDIRSLDDYAEAIPTVEKKDFVADQENAPPYGTRHAEVIESGLGIVPIITSGTTGQGIEVHLQTPDDVRKHSEVNAYHFRWAGMQPGDSIAMPMHVSLLAGGRCEYHAALDYGLSIFPIGMYDTAKRIELLKRFKPRALIGTTSYFGHLASVAGDELSEIGIELLFCGAEAASNSWFKRLEENFGAKAFDRYGLSQMATDHMFSCEFGVGTAERPGTLHNIDTHVLLEIIDLETGRPVSDGERGEIVLTSLYREMVPIIRCRTRDTAIYRTPRQCVCGRAFSGIEIGSVARLDDVKKIKGINVWPQAIDHAVFEFPAIEDYRVILTTDGVNGEVATLEFAPKHQLEESASTMLCEGLASSLVSVGSIPPSEHKARRWDDQRAQFQN